jgi:Icc-related predicted phosphoesterase
MKIQIVSDLHLEFHRDYPELFELPKTDADVIVLAGDVDVGFEKEFKFCQHLIDTHEKPVIFVLGNHSFYATNADVQTIRNQWKAVDVPNLHYLDEGISTTIKDTQFLGGILWTDYALEENGERDVLSMQHAHRRMNDFRSTFINTAPFIPMSSIEEHHKIKSAMEKIIKDTSPLKRVVVTHHLPSYRGVDALYRESDMNPAYASHMDEWIKTKDINLWVHGHIHVSKDYNIGNTRVVSNPRGYYKFELNYDFNPEMVIEI